MKIFYHNDPDGKCSASIVLWKDPDVSEIAKKYEYHGKIGGGHKGAAGFECEYPPFLPKLSVGHVMPFKIVELYDRDGTIIEGIES